MIHSATQRTAVLGIFTLLFVLVIPILFAERAQAGVFQQVYVRPDRLKASTATTGLICAKPATVGVENDVQVTFPSAFTLGLAATFTVNTSNLPSGATIWPGIATATNVTGQVVTFPSTTDLVVGTLYCFNWALTTAVQTGTSGGSQTGTITTRTSGPATIDSSSYAVAIVADDQIAVTATVPATFTFALGSNTAAIGTLSTTTASATGVTVTIGTNAAAGWVAWVKSANAALNSASTSATVATAGTVNDAPSDLASLDGYVLDVNYTDSATGTGTLTQAAGYGAEYAGGNNTDAVGGTAGGTLSTAFQPIAASSGTTDGDVLTLIVRAKISAVQTPATDYADTLTVVAAGRF
jgi:hypothetical protein